jgi:HSP20 family protein
MITIKGTRKHSEEVKEDNFFYRELYWGAFSRSIILPEEVDDDKAEASIKNGILTIKLPLKRIEPIKTA